MNNIFPHKVNYISEKEFNSIILKITSQINKGEWNDISFPPYAVLENRHVLLAEQVRSIFLMNNTYNDDMEKTLIRLFGERQYLKEAKEYLSWNRLRYDIENGHITDVNNLFLCYTNSYIQNIQQENKFNNIKFLIDNGANIDIQDDKGRTLLNKFINSYRSMYAYSEEYIIIEFIRFLLINGSDPFLEDKEGNSPYSSILDEVYKKYDHKFIMELSEEGRGLDNRIRLCEKIYTLILEYI